MARDLFYPVSMIPRDGRKGIGVFIFGHVFSQEDMVGRLNPSKGLIK
jgi:hypothetical protein